jgi:hypothetical protein
MSTLTGYLQAHQTNIFTTGKFVAKQHQGRSDKYCSKTIAAAFSKLFAPLQVADVSRFAVLKPDAGLEAAYSAAQEVNTMLLTLSQARIELDWDQPRAVL